mmetsp:Transcript_31756/g.43329  ORF Transcript_31756/g.43329 Transcript_31756/m.43329 type:complete len:205 (+) Transcript_31756:50-664(+)|eukprot:CAMPEP_0170068296 /NCGR_PEP_ID=MMETSP0019_2-20121128/7317_1 /TAXON_ID=98059 /ORGANISM="Dinobryon sp., Strain UTEXLB2267" /LENGTH=204 /DNA_ID=CAMNT_0010275891 /DNA_START=67 /DNA_END=681 /DNA_ORIENTATION=-
MFSQFVTIALLVASCNAYAPSTRTNNGRAATILSAEKSKSIPFLSAPKNLAGLVGDKGFDPVGFSDFIDVKFLREAELKHGRIAMLATLGFVATEFIKLPGDVHSVSPVAAHGAAVASGAMVQILALVSALEAVSVVAVKQMLEGSGRQPGEYGFDPLNFSNGKSDAVKADLQLKELENGRLAMVAFSGIVTQAVLADKGFPYF